MERLERRQGGGMDAAGLKKWGLLFLALGIIGTAVLQNGILGLDAMTQQEVQEHMQASTEFMGAATLSVFLQGASTCAIPIFALLMVEAIQRAESFRRLVLRILGIAVISELPFNLAMGGRLVVLSTRNPVFALVIAAFMLLFFRRCEEKTVGNRLIKIAVTGAALAWCILLGVQDGFCVIVMSCVWWAFRNKPQSRIFAGLSGMLICMMYSPLYMAAPLSLLVTHFYNGEAGEDNPAMTDLAYPVMLVGAGILVKFL